MADDGPIGTRNRDVFDSPDVVRNYERLTGLSPAEQELFRRFVTRGSRVLDLGVGTGRTTPALAGTASSYLGIDVAPNMVARARLLHPQRDFRVGDATDLSTIPDGSVDVVVFSYNGLDYVVPADRRHTSLSEIARVLAPGGTFIFSTHDPRALIRPRNRELGIRAWPVAWVQTARRVSRRLRRRAFWTGQGLIEDPAGGRLVTMALTPSRVEADLRRHGFRLRTALPSLHPAPARALGTEWWYYAFTADPTSTDQLHDRPRRR